jgi:aromatic ring-opening dioxygenase catalytic subunit (LigB family)
MSYENNHLLYDYYNFPEEMYKVKFESKGSPAVASRIVELLNQVCLLLIESNYRTISSHEH